MKPTEYIWMNGKLVKWNDANIHVCSHVVHYGSSVFEGMRIYKTEKGPVAFRLKDHSQRLVNSAKIYYMNLSYSADEISKAILDTVGINNMEECYVRPIAYRGYGTLGVDPSKCPVDLAIAVWFWGKYLGADALEKGVSVGISSWNRPAPNTLPMMAKSGANYMNGQLIKLEAIAHGYVEGIALDVNGNVSEGSAQNVFLIKNDELFTPDLASSVLPGLTRDSVMTLARDLGYKVTEANIPRESLYIADEVFFTGSAAEITPISSIDRITIGSGTRGPITKALQDELFGIINGAKEDKFDWLTYVPEYKGVTV